MLLFRNVLKSAIMKKRLLHHVVTGSFILFAMSACNHNIVDVPEEEVAEEEENEEEEVITIDQKTLATNKWIWENMEDYYYWNDELPDTTEVNYKEESDPEEYFYKLLYGDDGWSWITDDYASLAEEYGITSRNNTKGIASGMGYDPTFYTFSDGLRVFIVVNYVYPGSAAELAGLKRGNIILSINNTELDTTNYYDLYSGTAYSVELGKITVSGNYLYISDSGKSLSLAAGSGSFDPAIYYEVIDTLGYKIGYLAYTEFIAGTNDAYLSSMDAIFNEFKSAGVSDLIVDVRYNPGGLIDAAVHLASEIAPASTVSAQDILVRLMYNDDYQAIIEKFYPDELYYKFENISTNLNLNQVYFLTTWATASASELVITGLEPYMDVIQIGESTYGKYVGSYILPDDNEEWAILPVVMKYANANGYTDFTDGLTPDYEIYDDLVYDDPTINDDLIYYYPLGNASDGMTEKAIQLIAGVKTTSLATRSKSIFANQFSKFAPVGNKINLKRNLFVPVKSEIKERALH
jgi:carboxyl-terminal processing protease